MRERINNYTLTRPRMKKALGWFLVVIGFVAVIAPVIPGAPLVFFGLELLGLRLILWDKLKKMFTQYTAQKDDAVIEADIEEVPGSAS